MSTSNAIGAGTSFSVDTVIIASGGAGGWAAPSEQREFRWIAPDPRNQPLLQALQRIATRTAKMSVTAADSDVILHEARNGAMYGYDASS